MEPLCLADPHGRDVRWSCGSRKKGGATCMAWSPLETEETKKSKPVQSCPAAGCREREGLEISSDDEGLLGVLQGV